jgi:hypothetical protein
MQRFSKDGASSKAVGSRKSLIWVMRSSLAYEMVHKHNYTMHERPEKRDLGTRGVRREARGFASEGGSQVTERKMPTRKTSHSDQSLEGHRDIAPETLRVWLLGGFQVSVGARRIEQSEWRLKKAIALVKLLALAPGHRLHREQAMEALWPEANRKAASNNLRTTLHATRKILDSIEGSRYLTSQDDSLVLCPQGSVKGGVALQWSALPQVSSRGWM